MAGRSRRTTTSRSRATTSRSRKTSDGPNISRTLEPCRTWTWVKRPPAPGVGFVVEQYVPTEELTVEERVEYLGEAVEEEATSAVALVDESVLLASPSLEPPVKKQRLDDGSAVAVADPTNPVEAAAQSSVAAPRGTEGSIPTASEAAVSVTAREQVAEQP